MQGLGCRDRVQGWGCRGRMQGLGTRSGAGLGYRIRCKLWSKGGGWKGVGALLGVRLKVQGWVAELGCRLGVQIGGLSRPGCFLGVKA